MQNLANCHSPVFSYEGDVLKAMHKLKCAGIEDLANPMAGFLCHKYILAEMETDVIKVIFINKF